MSNLTPHQRHVAPIGAASLWSSAADRRAGRALASVEQQTVIRLAAVRGDATGDGIDDITFWEPATGIFSTLTSDDGFDANKAVLRDPSHFREMQLGLFIVHVPLSWNRRDGFDLFTVVNHSTGERFFRKDNDPDAAITRVQWGLPGDAQG